MLKRLVKLGVSSLVWVSDVLTDTLRRVFGLSPRRKFVVLYYHGISDREKTAFERQMRQLAATVTPVPCDTQQFNGSTHYAAVTFDDAFLSVRDHALPILKREKIPAAIFVPTAYLGTTPGWVKKKSLQGRNEVVMTPEEIGVLASEPLITIGSHTVTHPRVSELPPEAALAELRDSRSELEKITGKSIGLFSFPHGGFSPRDLELARQVGYTRVYGIHPALASPDAEFMIGRVAVDPSDWPWEFRLKLLGAYRWLSRSKT